MNRLRPASFSASRHFPPGVPFDMAPPAPASVGSFSTGVSGATPRGARPALGLRLLAGLLLGLGLSATAATEPGEKDAIALVEKGAAFMKTHSKEEMIKRVNAKDPDYLQGQLYLTMRDLKGVILANPVNQAMIGKDLIDVPDADGKLFRREIVELAKKRGKGWVDYKFKNPVSGKIEAKTSYIQLVGDVTLEAGIYKK